MRTTLSISGALLLSIAAFTAPAFAWSEQNCRSECGRRMAGQEAACYAQFNCAQYRGGKQVGASQQKAKADALSKKRGYQ